MKRATKEQVTKRREKPLVQAVNLSEHAAPITLRFPLPESTFDPGDFEMSIDKPFFIRIAIG